MAGGKAVAEKKPTSTAGKAPASKSMALNLTRSSAEVVLTGTNYSY